MKSTNDNKQRRSTTTTTVLSIADDDHDHDIIVDINNEGVAADPIPVEPSSSSGNPGGRQSNVSGNTYIDFLKGVLSWKDEPKQEGELEAIEQYENYRQAAPSSNEEIVKGSSGMQEVVGDEDGDGKEVLDDENCKAPHVPIGKLAAALEAQQEGLMEKEAAIAANRRGVSGSLEIVGGEGDEDISNAPPVPIEKLAALLEEEEELDFATASSTSGNSATAPTPSSSSTKGPHAASTFTRTVSLRAASQVDNNHSSSPDKSSLFIFNSDDADADNGLQSVVAEGGTSAVEMTNHLLVTETAPPMTMDDDIEQQQQQQDNEENEEEESSSSPPVPLLEATLVDDKVYDAVAFHVPWWKRYPKCAVGGLLLVFAVAAVVVGAGTKKVLDARSKKKEFPDFTTDVCFTNRTELVEAIKQYDDQDCSNNGDCEVGQLYGWPMNSWCVSEVQDMSGLFKNRADNATFNEDLSKWNVRSATNMSSMFRSLEVFNSDLSRWNVSSVTDMSYMFDDADHFSCNLSSWDVSSVTNMSHMFADMNTFNGDVSSWNVSSVTDMYQMFVTAELFNGSLSRWDVSSVTDMRKMFFKAETFHQDLCDWVDKFPYKKSSEIFEESNCTNPATPTVDARGPFCNSYCPKTFTNRTYGVHFTNRSELLDAIDQYLENDCSNIGGCAVGQKYGWPMNTWNVSKIQDMAALFSERRHFDEVISDWDVSAVTNMSYMFQDAVVFRGNLSSWNVSSVTNMNKMFAGAAKFNSDLSNWDVSSVTDMSFLFCDAEAFNTSLANWDVGSVRIMKHMFDDADTFNDNLSSWDVSAVTNMNGMFAGADTFNGDLSSWDVSSVTDMSSMFNDADAFNGNLSSWNISSVTDMTEMFNGATSFNQDLCDWVDKVPYSAMFEIFTQSSCTNPATPTLDARGPFCASSSCPNPGEN